MIAPPPNHLQHNTIRIKIYSLKIVTSFKGVIYKSLYILKCLLRYQIKMPNFCILICLAFFAQQRFTNALLL